MKVKNHKCNRRGLQAVSNPYPLTRRVLHCLNSSTFQTRVSNSQLFCLEARSLFSSDQLNWELARQIRLALNSLLVSLGIKGGHHHTHLISLSFGAKQKSVVVSSFVNIIIINTSLCLEGRTHLNSQCYFIFLMKMKNVGTKFQRNMNNLFFNPLTI